MKKGIAKFTAFCLAAGMTFGEGGAVYFAAPSTTLVGVGNDNIVKKTVKETEAAETEAPAQTEAAETEAPAQTEAPETEAPETEAPAQTEAPQTEAAPETEAIDTSMVGTTGFAQCSEYVNVRSSADTEGDVVGKIYANGAVEILDVDAYGWYHIRSGNVEGYVAGQYIATGDAAAAIAATSSYTTAYVGAEVLNVRSSASGDGEVIATLTNAQEIEVVADEGEWLKVALDSDTYGYISHDYASTTTSYATGETIEEEQARLDAQWIEYLQQQEAAVASTSSADTAYTEDASADTSYTYTEDTSYTDSSYTEAPVYTEDTSYTDYTDTTAAYTVDTTASYSDLQSQADALYQAYLTAQAAADAATAGSDTQAVYDTAAAAQAAYAAYLTAQNAADAAAVGAAQTTAVETPAPAETYTTQDSSYTEPAAVQEQPQTEAPQTEAPQTEAPAETEAPAPAASSAGQSAADYAVQFVGNPYVWGGASLTGGADCSGFTMAVLANYGVSLPHNAAAQSGCGSSVSLDSLQPGDLIFYGDGISHVAMYIGGGQVVHASNETNGIIISNYTYRSPVCARRYL